MLINAICDKLQVDYQNNMDDETQKIIAEQMKKLPKDVVGAIISVDYKTKLQEITQRQRLLIDQAGKLEMETTLVMIGLEPLADYISNLQRELGIPSNQAKIIALDISENIFKPIRNSLQMMNEAGEAEETPATKFTDSNEIGLNRDQILDEIENPVSNRSSFTQPTSQPVTLTGTELEIRPTQEIQINNQGDSLNPKKGVSLVETGSNLLQSKMSDITITTRQVVDVKTENKLPEIPTRQIDEKKRPYGGADPYREEIK